MRNLVDLLTPWRQPRRQEAPPPEPEPERCLSCGADLSAADLYRRYRVCPSCRFHYSLPARERIALLADPDTFKETSRHLTSLDPLSFSSRLPYRQRIFEAQRRTGLTEAAITGTCRILGKPCVVVVLDFGFLGGSMGCVVGEKVALAFELAVKRRLPLIAVVTSGGARVQEGILSLMQLGKTAAAARRMHQAGLPYICVMASPATGGVYASFANLADILLAEPGALMGYAAMRVVEEATGQPLPQGSHTAESHLAHGMIDQVVPRPRLRESLSALLDLLAGPRYRLTPAARPEVPSMPEREGASAWQAVQLARHPLRPTARDYILRLAPTFVELRGDRYYGDDRAVVCGIGDIGGQPVMIVGQQHSRREQMGGREGWIQPEGFRKAQRAMLLAAKFRLPLVTIIDTPGAYAGLDSEERGVGNAIAQCLATMSDLPTPTVAIIVGEGGSEGALAFGLADRILMLENAVYSVMAPEEAAGILYRDEARADEVASALRLTAQDCRELEVIDRVVPEPEGGAHTDPDEMARRLKNALLAELSQLQEEPVKKLVQARYRKFRRMGEYSSYFGAAIAREASQLQGFVQRRAAELLAHLPARPRRPTGEDEASALPESPQ